MAMRTPVILAVFAWSIAGGVALAQDETANLWRNAHPLLDVRVRYEHVDQTPFAEAADALTARVRAGFESGNLFGTHLLAEAGGLVALESDYRPDNASPYHSQFPLVADPHEAVINRFALVNSSLPATSITVGRQRINLDDQRFVGASGWRQEEQTFDGVRVVSQFAKPVTVDLTWFDRVHRVFGRASPQGAYDGDGWLANVSVPTPIGKLTAFDYLLDFDPITAFQGLTAAQAAPLNPVRAATGTAGARFAGEQPLGSFHLGYVASWARQRPRGRNPFQGSNDYFIGELALKRGGGSLAIGDEHMQGNGTWGFSTPLGTVHPFDGWADKFLVTPANGLDNQYLRLGWQQRLGRIDALTVGATARRFQAVRVSTGYGWERDLQVAARKGRVTLSVFYADYRADADTPLAIARDTSKLWVQCEYQR